MLYWLGSSQNAAINLQKSYVMLAQSFQMIYRMVVMHICRSNLGSRTEHWFPKKEPVHKWTWRFDALGSSDQNTADRECETPTLFLKDKGKEKEEKSVINYITADPFLRSTLVRYKSWTVFVRWPALGNVAIRISSGLAWKFWTSSQLSVK